MRALKKEIEKKKGEDKKIQKSLETRHKRGGKYREKTKLTSYSCSVQLYRLLVGGWPWLLHLLLYRFC